MKTILCAMMFAVELRKCPIHRLSGFPFNIRAALCGRKWEIGIRWSSQRNNSIRRTRCSQCKCYDRFRYVNLDPMESPKFFKSSIALSPRNTLCCSCCSLWPGRGRLGQLKLRLLLLLVLPNIPVALLATTNTDRSEIKIGPPVLSEFRTCCQNSYGRSRPSVSLFVAYFKRHMILCLTNQPPSHFIEPVIATAS